MHAILKKSNNYMAVCGSENITATLLINKSNTTKWRNIICLYPLFLILALILVVLIFALFQYTMNNCILSDNYAHMNSICEEDCNIQLVESIPEGLNFSHDSPKFMSTFEAWRKLIHLANETLEIGSLYWTLRAADVMNHTSAADGEHIFQQLLSSGMNRKFKIRIAQNLPIDNKPNIDTNILVRHNAANVRSVNFPRLLGNGVLHTKLWVADNKHFYLGSANMDWRSLTQVKELGVLVTNCACLAHDVNKIFKAYWHLGGNTSTVPKKWPDGFSTNYNYENPLDVFYNGRFNMLTFFSNSPPPLSAKGRTNDLDAIINTILRANFFVNIAVMDYLPLIIYTPRLQYWPYIDDAIRKAAIEKKVHIKMLISWWPHSKSSEDYFLRSLTSLSTSFDGVNVQVKRFIVPSNNDQSKIPYGRVNHNKYMVTDNTAYIGTSNWSGDYFTDTAGIGLVIRENENCINTSKRNIRHELLSVFERDWESPYSVEINKMPNE